MSVTQTLTWSVASDSGSKSLSGTQTETGTAEVAIDASFAAGSTDVAYTVAFAHTTLKSFFLVADKNCTIKVNSAGSPILTINLVAGAPYVWDASTGYFSNPFSADVTAFYVTCTASTRLRGKALN